MSRECIVCAKGTQVGNKVSHAQNKTKRKLKANLRSFKLPFLGGRKRFAVCTRCIRSINKWSATEVVPPVVA